MINYSVLQEKLPDLTNSMSEAKPFPHVIIDDFLEPGHVRNIERGFSDALAHIDPKLFKKHQHVKNKIGCPNKRLMNDAQTEFFQEIYSSRFLKYLEKITNICPIYSDNELNGGGLHQIGQGGYLNIHTDFNYHPKTNKHRRLNLIFYVNSNWEESWGGQLQLWDEKVKNCCQIIAPIKNRAVLFETSEISFHGHPTPLNCPENMFRRSCAVYYYSEWPKDLEKRAKTNYVLTPAQESSLISAIKFLVSQDSTISETSAFKRLPEWQPDDIKRILRCL